jgi:hypothetical protein
MKSKAIKMILITTILISIKAYPQGFVNLNFENATVTRVSPDFPNYIYASNAIPGWTTYLGGASQDGIGYNTVSLGGAAIFLEDTNANSLGPPPIQGTYSILLEGSTASTPTAASIGQTGQIPPGTMSMTFWGYSSGVSFGGQSLSLVVLSTTPNYYVYGADVSALVGQTGQLLFTAQPGDYNIIDNIQFSSSPIPEPSSLALGALGASLLGFRRWRNFHDKLIPTIKS